MEYLGHIIGNHTVSMDLKKKSNILEWPVLRSVKKLIDFLGLTGYYQKFIKNYGVIAHPLTRLLKK